MQFQCRFCEKDYRPVIHADKQNGVHILRAHELACESSLEYATLPPLDDRNEKQRQATLQLYDEYHRTGGSLHGLS